MKMNANDCQLIWHRWHEREMGRWERVAAEKSKRSRKFLWVNGSGTACMPCVSCVTFLLTLVPFRFWLRIKLDAMVRNVDRLSLHCHYLIYRIIEVSSTLHESYTMTKNLSYMAQHIRWVVDTVVVVLLVVFVVDVGLLKLYPFLFSIVTSNEYAENAQKYLTVEINRK